jgi:integrase
LREARTRPRGARTPRLLAAGKFKRVTPHALRHTAGSWIIQETGEISDTGVWLGHTSERTSRIYAHHDPRYLRRISDAIERRRTGGLPPMAGNSPFRTDEK